jgi:hypothetical protein
VSFRYARHIKDREVEGFWRVDRGFKRFSLASWGVVALADGDSRPKTRPRALSNPKSRRTRITRLRYMMRPYSMLQLPLSESRAPLIPLRGGDPAFLLATKLRSSYVPCYRVAPPPHLPMMPDLEHVLPCDPVPADRGFTNF